MSFTTRTRTAGSTRTQPSSTSCDPPQVEEGGSEPPGITQRLWVLVGIVGSGKSTLADAICDQIPNWTRVCQDELGDRKACEAVTLEAFSEGKHVIVDRQNFDTSQRKVWIDLARKASSHITVTALVFSTSDEECRRRLTLREDHPTIDSPEKALEIHDKFRSWFEDVSVTEGFDQIFSLPSDLPQMMDVGSVMRLIAQVDASPRLPKPTPWTLARGRGRGQSRGDQRGRGRGAGASGRGNGGNRFNTMARPPPDQAPTSPWARMGSGATLSSASTTSTVNAGSSSHADGQAQSQRAQMAQAAEARRRAMEASTQSSTSTPAASSEHPAAAHVAPPQPGKPPTKRLVIDLSSDDI